jgi:hypothetical protein
MSSIPDSSDSVVLANPSSEPRRDGPEKFTGTKAVDADEVSPPLVIISEHEVALGTAAATGIAPPAPRRNGWIATLARLAKPSRDRCPQHPQHPGSRRSDYLAGARMAREMCRL